MVLLGRSAAELKAWVEAQGQPGYRGQQLHQWLYRKGARSLQEITVFPKQWRAALADVEIGRSEIRYRHDAQDGTVKLLLALADGETIETVGIPSSDRLTVCVSSQVGCPMACDFCATGKGGYRRNLACHEILDQVLTIQSEMGRRVSHVVFMGMGEPLLNLPAVLQAITCLNRDIGIGQRHITISTVGIPQQIQRLAQHQLQTTLAVSLHAPNQALREQLIPSAKHYPLSQLIADCRAYVQQTGRRITFEYTVLAGVNDRPQHAEELAQLLRGFQSHVNLIPYNPIAEAAYQRPTDQHLRQFLSQLQALGVTASIRRSRGLDRQAACGQLRQAQLIA
ncbi:23S rRNA (adenine(2503)-C(2))-methyltransferase RlmN [Thermosynechococcus vestitus]|uniref:Probable dual-specificity RNA methyltransferase RlmN n=1 Tax=Thermosynechococcus vestitus (strain NIES-2133 / IAM M-273 / BP-1) TaxID=197221 RepID=RLMN_THEVB|nr:23S rRNA (adenine(2503)-C(2))-methyltransferase RlmN [Thermosynechococcus vestitus]Q8DG98.1 RecName: Full=Probable dual-specificity RNA methyltransferase RlmN; AltName: Full=23S rRNA (adenine(2503)-C(2))-methyltransferase; AltName: Full=23S rRNA m2A2503 methyltransferase; AltName: Full=Ribosomal RNA large subunit methyltransferase N; AltName: Full=tRNA (adenine(37)-C(2))-methyltransferase; AltName: Full=tRNA m2A37 methyltransferase [Thermosynechococcus vestitus BP-1]BAC09977.1 tll2425 [Thermos